MNGRTMGWLLGGLALLWQPVQAQTVVEYIHTDALGSVVLATDQSRNVLERREYEPYGLQLTPAVQDGPGYTGHVQDVVTGLTYMQQRYYEPQLGVFLSVDPVTAYDDPVGMFHRYRYANNNPYRFTDPDGRQTLPPSIYQIDWANPQTREAFQDTASVAADFTPVLGDVKGFVDAYNDPSAANIVAAGVGLVPIVGDGAAKLIKGADKAISMEKAIDDGIRHVGPNADVVMTRGGNVQFTSTATDAAGNTVTRNARFDVNPSNAHVQKRGPHLNLETQVNGRKTGVDPHTPIDPETIRRGDYD